MSSWWIQRFGDYATRPFLVEGGNTYTYEDLLKLCKTQIAELQETGIQAGDVVALHGNYTLSGIAAIFALFELKAIAAPIAVASDQEIQQREEAAQANWRVGADGKLVCTQLKNSGEPHKFIKQLRADKKPGLILFSSGSTGKPKAMVHNANSLLKPFANKRPRKLCILIFLLYDHIGGLNTLFNGIGSGAMIVVPASRDPHAVAKAIESHKVKLLPASPTFLNLLLISGATESHDLSSVRFITYGTEPMPESLLVRIQEKLPNVSLIQTFGTSETGISQTTSHSSKSTLIKFDDTDTEYKIVESELWLRSKSQIMGYLNHDNSRFTDDGWFITGDLVKKAKDGYIRILGRREELINVGGEKVTPSEVESVLLELPSIIDCTVFGQKNPITGNNVAAKVVVTGEYEERQIKRLIKQHCRKRLSAYKVPARIILVDNTKVSARFKKQRIEDSEC